MNIDVETVPMSVSLTLSFISACKAKQNPDQCSHRKTFDKYRGKADGLVAGKRAEKLGQRKKWMSAAAAAAAAAWCTVESRR